MKNIVRELLFEFLVVVTYQKYLEIIINYSPLTSGTFLIVQPILILKSLLSAYIKRHSTCKHLLRLEFRAVSYPTWYKSLHRSSSQEQLLNPYCHYRIHIHNLYFHSLQQYIF